MRGDEDEEPDRERLDDEPADGPESARKRFERVVPDLLKRALERGIEAGLGTINRTADVAQHMGGGSVKLPKEIANYLFAQIDETKNSLLKAVAGEVRDFLEATDLAKELQKALTTLSFEIKTEIRFIPNDSGGIKADVKSAATTVKRTSDGTEVPAPEPKLSASDERRERRKRRR